MYNGYVYKNVVILEIFEGLPHTKTKSKEFEKWQKLIHETIGIINLKFEVKFFEKAHIGIYTQLPSGRNHKVWDITNRAVNVTINNLKGIFFPDDDAEHLSIIAAGKICENSKTIIYIGDFFKDYETVNFLVRLGAVPTLDEKS